MSILELKDERANLLDQNKNFLANAEKEVRKLNDEESTAFNNNIEAINKLTKQIETASKEYVPEGRKITNNNEKIKNINMEKRFSLIESINNKLEGRNHNEAALSIFTQGKEEMRKSGLTTTGDIVIPTEYRADILAGTSGAGQEIVSEDKMAIMPPLENKLVLAQAGATFLKGLVGNVSVPSYGGTTVAWKGEVAAADDGGGTFSEVNLSPKRITAKIDVSKLFLAQDSVGAERMLLDNIASAVAQKLESTILGVAVGSTTQPQGMGYKCTTGADTKAAAIAPTWALMVGLETTVDTANAANGKLGYITNAGGRGILKSTLKASAAGAESLLEDGIMNGYPVYVTNGASAIAASDGVGDLVIFGNWAELCIAQWGGYDITVDPYTVAGEGQVRIVVNAYFDAKGLRGSAATDALGVTVPDEYAVAFASLGIK